MGREGGKQMKDDQMLLSLHTAHQLDIITTPDFVIAVFIECTSTYFRFYSLESQEANRNHAAVCEEVKAIQARRASSLC